MKLAAVLAFFFASPAFAYTVNCKVRTVTTSPAPLVVFNQDVELPANEIVEIYRSAQASYRVVYTPGEPAANLGEGLTAMIYDFKTQHTRSYSMFWNAHLPFAPAVVADTKVEAGGVQFICGEN